MNLFYWFDIIMKIYCFVAIIYLVIVFFIEIIGREYIEYLIDIVKEGKYIEYFRDIVKEGYIEYKKKTNKVFLITKFQSIKIYLTIKVKIVDFSKLYTLVGVDYETKLINVKVNEMLQDVISKYTIKEIIDKRYEINKLITKNIHDDLVKYGITIINAFINIS